MNDTIQVPQLDARSFARVRALMHESIGLTLPDSKHALVAARLAPRLRQLGLASFSDYVALLDDPAQSGEFQCAVDLLSTNETYFFRERHHFEALAAEIRRQGARESLSIWSAASSFGDEAYSIAMLLTDMRTAGQLRTPWRILATDISERVLHAAKAGVFPEQRLREVSPEQLRRHCLRGEGPAQGQVMVRPELREQVRFGQLNLCRSITGIGEFDFIFLRNVLIYFDPPTKAAVIDRVSAHLRPGGILFLGTAEGRPTGQTAFSPIVPGAYRKAS